MSTPQDNKARFWRSPIGLVFAVFLAVAAFLLVSEHGAHVLGAAPLLLVLAVCIGAHFFMHGGHRAHPDQGPRESDHHTDEHGDSDGR
jgi:heme/copper-type cytochrome/quinol oxidase subunit 4